MSGEEVTTEEICRLCHGVKSLRSSHIIPEFLYSSMYDEKHRFHIFSTTHRQMNRLAQKGVREKLLCEDCEQKLSKWESYASQFLNGGTAIVAEQEGSQWHLSELDYKSFRLFQLSILWRASISTLDFFSNISLGKHEEKIRRLLLSSDPGLSWQYGCVMCSLVGDGGVVTDLMIQPDRLKLCGQTAYRFIFGGFMWIYLASNHTPPKLIKSAFLSPAGKMTMLVKNIENVKYIEGLAIDLFKHGKV